LLLAISLASARERIIVSFQRADDDGKKAGRSSVLRELARVFTGRADARIFLDSVDCVPAHPALQGLHLASSPSFQIPPASTAAIAAAAAGRPGKGVEAARAGLNSLWARV